MLDAAEKRKTKLKASGVILMGDFNARHCSWGHNINNYYGTQLAETLDNTKYSVCTPKTPTFLCSNGKSYIDLNIISNSIAESVDNCVTDDYVELFSGAPTRGHVPVITELLTTRDSTDQAVIEKLDLSKMQWENWTQTIENKLTEISDIGLETNPYKVWEQLDQIITEATDTYCQTKKCSKHSKPYWTANLTILSKNLRRARKYYLKRNTDPNLQKFQEAKNIFDEERKRACQEFLINTAKN